MRKKAAEARDYAKMVIAASDVVVRTRNADYRSTGRAGIPEYVLVDFPRTVRFGEGFPKGHAVYRSVDTTTYKINAARLLNWLYENGHSTYNATMLVKETKDFERLVGSIDRMFE